MNILGLSIEYRRTRSNTGRSRTVVIGVLVASVSLGGVALAGNWITNGAGTGAAKAGTAQSVTAPTLTVSTSTSGLLVPNGTSAVAVSVTNPNNFQVVVSGISVSAAGTPTSVVPSGSCTTANAKVSIAAVSTFTLGTGAIPAGQTVSFTSTTSPVTMAIDSDNNCQNASFGFSASVTAAAG
jgi:hypothetical protein